jgi:hypothetical protein
VDYHKRWKGVSSRTTLPDFAASHPVCIWRLGELTEVARLLLLGPRVT